MASSTRWKVVLVSPGESEVSLLATLSQRPDLRIAGVIDPAGEAVGTAIAEVMGLPIVSDIAALDMSSFDYLVYSDSDPECAPIVQQARAAGKRVLSAREFERRLQPPEAAVKSAPAAPRHFERLEQETESIHRTLSRIEEALRRESLLRWLLSLATRAVGATGGSIMLFDEKTAELYIAFGYGLSEATLHRTRVAIGEGIAGRVAKQLQSELVQGQMMAEQQRDRPDITGAISTPLIWENRLLGVLNLSVVRGDAPLAEDDLATADRLARRLSLILDRFLSIQKAQAGELFRQTDHQLLELMRESDDLTAVLSAWAGTLALGLESSRLSLAVACSDGTLLVAEGSRDGETSARYEVLEDAAWREVFERGSPLVLRQRGPRSGKDNALTVFYLPVGKNPVQAVLTVAFDAASEAHRFHDISGEIIYLLEKRLLELLSRVRQKDRLERLTTLSIAMAEIASAGTSATNELCDRLLDTARKLTGARRAYLVTEIVGGRAHLEDAGAPNDAAWLEQAARLLGEAQPDGWRVTLLSGSAEPRLSESCLLAVTASSRAAAPSILLFEKQRLHPLDGSVFSDFDGELAHRLTRLLPGCLQAAAPAATRLAVLQEIPSPEPQPATVTVGAGETATEIQHDLVLDILRREMDRCDRYHTAFALLAMRPELAAGKWDQARAQGVLESLGRRTRSSDILTCMADGTLLLLAPEDVQAVARLERRLVSEIQQLAPGPQMTIASSHMVYPGRHDDASQLLADTLSALQSSH